MQMQAVYERRLDRYELEETVSKIISARRNRSLHFPAGIFSDPAWDILLQLTLAESRCVRLTTSSLCDAIDAPTTTALRWIGLLADEGLVVRHDDVNDKRRTYIELSSDAFASMNDYCSTADLPGTLRV